MIGDCPYNFFALFYTGFNFRNVSLGFIVKIASLDLVLSDDGEVLLDGQLSLPKARTCLSSSHDCDKSEFIAIELCSDRLQRGCVVFAKQKVLGVLTSSSLGGKFGRGGLLAGGVLLGSSQ